MTDLRTLALAAQEDGFWPDFPFARDHDTYMGDRLTRYLAAASPAVVLALLDCIAAADEVVHWQVQSSSTDDVEQAYFDARDRLAEVLGGR